MTAVGPSYQRGRALTYKRGIRLLEKGGALRTNLQSAEVIWGRKHDVGCCRPPTYLSAPGTTSGKRSPGGPTKGAGIRQYEGVPQTT